VYFIGEDRATRIPPSQVQHYPASAQPGFSTARRPGVSCTRYGICAQYARHAGVWAYLTQIPYLLQISYALRNSDAPRIPHASRVPHASQTGSVLRHERRMPRAGQRGASKLSLGARSLCLDHLRDLIEAELDRSLTFEERHEHRQLARSRVDLANRSR